MRDPVNDFDYPEEWVARCKDPDVLNDVIEGTSVLTSSGVALKRGFTTGTTASAACKAAVLSLRRQVSQVDIDIPCGLTVKVEAKGIQGSALCRKFSGDYPSDVTSGACFIAEASVCNATTLLPGQGIGRFVRDTPRGSRGSAAISPSAHGEIMLAIHQACREIGIPGATVKLEIENGEELARRTLNPRMGIEGGISVLGTTGLVEPWDDHLDKSNEERIANASRVVLTTGRNGLRYSRLLFPDHEVVLVGTRVKKALDIARGDVILAGMPALILKFIEPNILKGSGCATVDELVATELGRERMNVVLGKGKETYPSVRIVLFDRTGAVIGDTQ